MVDGQGFGSVMVDDFPAGTAVALGQGALSGRCVARPRWDLSFLMLTASCEPAGSVSSLPLEMESLLTAWGVRNSSREKCIAA